jgi:hypothetical protein
MVPPPRLPPSRPEGLCGERRIREGRDPVRDVRWWRVVLAFAATLVVLYSMTIALAVVGGSSIVWIFVYTIVSNAVWWGILLLPTRAHPERIKAR